MTENAVEEEGNHQWKEQWVIHLIILRGEMQETFFGPPKQGMFPFKLVLKGICEIELGILELEFAFRFWHNGLGFCIYVSYYHLCNSM